MGEIDWAIKLYKWSPAMALKLAEREGLRKLRRMRNGKSNAIPAGEQLERLLGPTSPAELEAIQQRAAKCQLRSKLVGKFASREGLEAAVGGMIEADPECDAITDEMIGDGKGVIVTTLHGGPKAGVWGYLLSRKVSLLKIQNHPWLRPPAHWQIHDAPQNAAEGVQILRRARVHLEAGGWVGTALDDFRSGTRRRTVRCLGRDVRLDTGIASLSTMTGAPTVLYGASWDVRRSKIRIEAQEPVYPECGAGVDEAGAEQALMEQLAERMGRFIRRYPWEFSGNHYRRLLGSA